MSERLTGTFTITDDMPELAAGRPGAVPLEVLDAVTRVLEQMYKAAYEHGAPRGYGVLKRWQLTLTTGHFSPSLGPHRLLGLEAQLEERRHRVTAAAMEEEIRALLYTRRDAPGAQQTLGEDWEA